VKRSPEPVLVSQLPARITGIIFWGTVLVGLLAIVFLLHGRQAELASRYELGADSLVNRFNRLLVEEAPDRHWLETQMPAAVTELREALGFEALRVDIGDEQLTFGEVRPGQTIMTRPLFMGAAGADGAIWLHVHYPNIESTIGDERKRILILMGLMLMLLGFLLQQIMKQMLTEPFKQMVETAIRCTSHPQSIRFDESRRDEFGFLGKFINQALESSAQKQGELQKALDAVRLSEKALYTEKERAEVTLRSIADAVITTDAMAKVRYMNPVAEHLTGWTNEQAYARAVSDIIKFAHDENGMDLPNPVDKCLAENRVEVLSAHGALLRERGETISVEASAAPMHNDRGLVMGAVIVIQDVSHARSLTYQLSYQASHDALTGLLNRRKFEERLEQALHKSWEDNRQHTLFYLDLDQFKVVNDTSGHIAGDELLRQLSQVLLENIREGDTLARLGGDEFGILLENCHLEQARIIANKLLTSVSKFRFAWRSRSFSVGASIGIVSVTPESRDLAELLSSADLACYAAKDSGRNRLHIYEAGDNALAERHGQMHWIAQITQALEENRFALYSQDIQPLQKKGEQRPIREITVCMIDPEGGVIEPDTFIPAAERYHFMTRIDKWVIRNAFDSIGWHLKNDGPEDGIIAINLSGATLTEPGILAFIKANAERNAVPFDNICFEITETVAISNITKATLFMSELKALGCRFALDDFGSGLSSFAYLKNLPVDYLKIDGGFILDIVSDSVNRAMVQSIVQIAKQMGITTIAEWVETEEVCKLLGETGVDYAQGFHIARPVDFSIPGIADHAGGRLPEVVERTSN